MFCVVVAGWLASLIWLHWRNKEKKVVDEGKVVEEPVFLPSPAPLLPDELVVENAGGEVSESSAASSSQSSLGIAEEKLGEEGESNDYIDIDSASSNGGSSVSTDSSLSSLLHLGMKFGLGEDDDEISLEDYREEDNEEDEGVEEDREENEGANLAAACSYLFSSSSSEEEGSNVENEANEVMADDLGESEESEESADTSSHSSQD
eukprot:gene39108-47584_t